MRYKKGHKNIFNIGYHIIWCPKYRRRILIGNIECRLKELLIQKSNELDIEIKSIEIMPDHIHIFIKCLPTNNINNIIKYLKGYSSRMLRKEFFNLKKYKNLWSRSYYCETVGHVSEKTIKKYIEDQKKK